MAEVYLRRLSQWQAEQQRDAAADVHVGAYRGVAGAEYRDRQGFLSRFEQHVQRPAFGRRHRRHGRLRLRVPDRQ